MAVFPICGDPDLDERGCVSRERLEPAVQLLAAVQPALVTAARDALCGRRELAAVPLPELAEMTGVALVRSRPGRVWHGVVLVRSRPGRAWHGVVLMRSRPGRVWHGAVLVRSRPGRACHGVVRERN